MAETERDSEVQHSHVIIIFSLKIHGDIQVTSTEKILLCQRCMGTEDGEFLFVCLLVYVCTEMHAPLLAVRWLLSHCQSSFCFLGIQEEITLIFS